jgi:hypothetical protein
MQDPFSPHFFNPPLAYKSTVWPETDTSSEGQKDRLSDCLLYTLSTDLDCLLAGGAVGCGTELEVTDIPLLGFVTVLTP